MTEEGFWWRGGDRVEVVRVISRGTAYYPANVVNAPSVRKKVVWVEHESLFVGNGDSVRMMKEYVTPTRLRPSPPWDIRRSFKAGDEVDVFRESEGFWVRGNVRDVIGNSKYVVELKGGNFQETEVDGLKNLRLHREWVDGNWVPSLKNKNMKRKIKFERKDVYEKGTIVEVRSDEPGYEGSWYSAKIINFLGKDRYMVEYQTLETEDYRELLKEEVKGSDIRPNPPQLVGRSTCRYELDEDVDVWYHDGWWSGRIYKINSSYTRYGVHFQMTDDRLEYGYSDLRPSQVWINGKWSRA